MQEPVSLDNKNNNHTCRAQQISLKYGVEYMTMDTTTVLFSISLPHTLDIVAGKCPKLLRPLTSAYKPPIGTCLDDKHDIAGM